MFGELTSCLCSAAASDVYFELEGPVAGLDATETVSELSQPTFEFTSLVRIENTVHEGSNRGKWGTACNPKRSSPPPSFKHVKEEVNNNAVIVVNAARMSPIHLLATKYEAANFTHHMK